MMRDPDNSRLQELARAPDLAPPEALWTRLRTGQRKALLRRRLLNGASASALALLLVAVVPWPAINAPTGLSADAVATIDGDAVHDQIVTIDRALQAAYARGASDVEVEPMWEMRNVLVARIAPRGGVAGPKGI